MKRIFFLAVLANASSMLTLDSCEEKSISVPGVSESSLRLPYTTRLAAYRWVKEANGIFASVLSGVIPSGYSNPESVRIYLEQSTRDIQINSFVPFMDGELWALSSQTDVIVHYKSGNQSLPFSYLNIKVVIE